MKSALPPIHYDIRLSAGVPAPFARAVRGAARSHSATTADYIREALNQALRREPGVGRDGSFSLIPTATSASQQKQVSRSKV